MYFDDAILEFGFDCKARKLSPKTIDNYRKQLLYLKRYLYDECRHTFAHLQLKNGLDLYSLSRVMGHESVAITQRYLEGIRDDQVIKAAQKSGVLANL